MSHPVSKWLAWLVISLTLVLSSGTWYWRMQQQERALAAAVGVNPSCHSCSSADIPPEQQRLLDAVKTGDEAAVRSLLRTDPSLLHAECDGEGGLLHRAARANQPVIIDVLVELGANLRSRGKWDGTPLHWAAWWGNAEAVEALLKHGASPEIRGDEFGATPLLWACNGSTNAPSKSGNYTRAVELLLAAGASPDSCNCEGVPSIRMASPEVAKVLLAHGASPLPAATQSATNSISHVNRSEPDTP